MEKELSQKNETVKSQKAPYGRDCFIIIRSNDDEKKLWNNNAKRLNMDVSNYIRYLVNLEEKFFTRLGNIEACQKSILDQLIKDKNK